MRVLPRSLLPKTQCSHHVRVWCTVHWRLGRSTAQHCIESVACFSFSIPRSCPQYLLARRHCSDGRVLWQRCLEHVLHSMRSTRAGGREGFCKGDAALNHPGLRHVSLHPDPQCPAKRGCAMVHPSCSRLRCGPQQEVAHLFVCLSSTKLLVVSRCKGPHAFR